MPKSYPKEAKDILLRVEKHDTSEGIRTDKTSATVNFFDKLHEYLVKLGHDNAHVYNVMVHLLTEGKVRVDFRYHTERIMLQDANDKLTRPQAIELMEDSLAAPQEKADDLGSTQRIVIQYPKK